MRGFLAKNGQTLEPCVNFLLEKAESLDHA